MLVPPPIDIFYIVLYKVPKAHTWMKIEILEVEVEEYTLCIDKYLAIN